jgi:hypothetical protein
MSSAYVTASPIRPCPAMGAGPAGVTTVYCQPAKLSVHRKNHQALLPKRHAHEHHYQLSQTARRHRSSRQLLRPSRTLNVTNPRHTVSREPHATSASTCSRTAGSVILYDSVRPPPVHAGQAPRDGAVATRVPQRCSLQATPETAAQRAHAVDLYSCAILSRAGCPERGSRAGARRGLRRRVQAG